jgi:3-hydroxyacyl-CoA dehydrogenase/enoyl-CoA hydratase/3-hydroxybutyryl-CoA epimerase
MGVEAFENRTAQLAAQFGPGFALTEQVKAAVRQHQPKY